MDSGKFSKHLITGASAPLGENMHVLTEINIKVHPVLLEAAKEHFFQSGIQIIAFKLPVWMYEKLSREPGFRKSAIDGWGQYLGYKVMRSPRPVPKMYENHSAFEYDVFSEDGAEI